MIMFVEAIILIILRQQVERVNTSIVGSKKIISVDYVSILLQYIVSHGFDATDVLEGAGIPQSLLDNKQGFLSVNQYSAILRNAQALLHDPVLGLRLGQLQHVAAHGPLGYAIMSSKNLDAAMHQVCRFIRIRNNLTSLEYTHHNGDTILRMEVSLPLGDLYQFVVEQSFASFMNIIKGFIGSSDFTLGTSFRYKQPENSALYKELFHEDPLFSAPFNEIRMDSKLLEGFDLCDDSVFANMAEKQCEKIMKNLVTNDDFMSSVYAIVGKNVGCFPSQPEVARQLGISTRSFVRRLSELGVSFSEIVKTTNYELAKHHLENTSWSIEEIAYLLDYENPANFSRSFKSWSGIPPSVYRKQSG